MVLGRGFVLSCLVFLVVHSLISRAFFSGSTSFFGDLVQRSHKEILPRDLLYRSVRRSCQEVSYRDLANRALVEIFVQRSCQETSYGDLVRRPGEESRGLACRLFFDSLNRRSCSLRSPWRFPIDTVQIALHRDLAQQLLQRTPQGGLAPRSSTEIFTKGTCRSYLVFSSFHY